MTALGASARKRLADPCPGCGRATGWRGDGQRRKHRTDAHNPLAAWCQEGAKDQR